MVRHDLISVASCRRFLGGKICRVGERRMIRMDSRKERISSGVWVSLFRISERERKGEMEREKMAEDYEFW
jgi:hypothetical protein